MPIFFIFLRSFLSRSETSTVRGMLAAVSVSSKTRSAKLTKNMVCVIKKKKKRKIPFKF